MPAQRLTWSTAPHRWLKRGSSGAGPGVPEDGELAWEFSETNVPWAYSNKSVFTEGWPVDTQIVDIQTGSSDFWTNLRNTVNAAPGRVVVRLGEGVYSLKSFRMAGSSGSPIYSFGFFFPNLQGLIGQGPDKTFVQMDANSMNQDQLDALAQMDYASFTPLQMALCRFDGSPASPVLIAGLTFRADDQQLLTNKAPDVPIVLPQPAPHQGVIIYSGSKGIISHVRFQGAARAATSRPPFEMANVASQRGQIVYRYCESDGRISADFNPARPRRCGVWMGNNEVRSELYRCYLHHSNISRYAANDENNNTAALSTEYIVTETKFEQITNTKNNGLGGYTNATPLGWESSNAKITITNCIINQDNPYTDNQIAQHFQLTSVGARDPQGGRMFVHGGVFRNAGFPVLDGFVCFRIRNSYWMHDGYDNTLNVFDSSGNRKLPHVVAGVWPPSASALAAAGITKETHYIIRN